MDDVVAAHRFSRMTIRTYTLVSATAVPVERGRFPVTRRRDPLEVPVSPLAWPPCRCPRCREGAS